MGTSNTIGYGLINTKKFIEHMVKTNKNFENDYCREWLQNTIRFAEDNEFYVEDVIADLVMMVPWLKEEEVKEFLFEEIE